MFGATVAMELGAALPVIFERLQIHRKSIVNFNEGGTSGAVEKTSLSNHGIRKP